MKIILNNWEISTAIKEYLENHKIVGDDRYPKSCMICIGMKKRNPDNLYSGYVPFVEISCDDY